MQEATNNEKQLSLSWFFAGGVQRTNGGGVRINAAIAVHSLSDDRSSRVARLVFGVANASGSARDKSQNLV